MDDHQDDMWGYCMVVNKENRVTSKHKYKVGDHVYMYDPDYGDLASHGIIKTAETHAGGPGYEITPDKYKTIVLKNTLWFWEDEVSGLYKEEKPKQQIYLKDSTGNVELYAFAGTPKQKKTQQYVYVVHQFADANKTKGVLEWTDHKILGVYKNREDAEEKRSRVTKHADIYTGATSPYVAVTRHKVKGEPNG